MQAEYWLKVWQEGRTGFHQTRANSRLQSLWPTLALPQAAGVFVPLCGKSLDMLWLHQHGHTVVGVELSEKAVQAFFDENSLSCERTEIQDFIVYTGVHDAAGIVIYVGDLFRLKSEHLQQVRSFYDRASLIALPPDMRSVYAAALAKLLPDTVIGLLITLSYDTSKMKGPPFSVLSDDVHRLFGEHFDITEVDSSSGPERLGNLADRGLETMNESVFRLERATDLQSPA